MGKARRKDRESSAPSQEEHKLYLEEAVLERKHSDTDLRPLVDLPPGLGYNEWLASHTIDFFQHINLVYGTISEYCTSSTCPDMNGPCQRQYFWMDEKGKKIKTTAPQYVDYVMTYIQKTLNDETVFPSKPVNDFPTDFELVVRRIFRLLFHVLAHVYHNHFREVMLLTLHAHLNCIFAHFTLFNERFKLIDDKETEVLHDLVVALKLAPRGVTSPPSASAAAAAAAADGDGDEDENKENIDVGNGRPAADKAVSMETDEPAPAPAEPGAVGGAAPAESCQ
ncbi:MOB kinase activator-like 2 [Amphibalanus amphitrite]|uniref:MOB kinase activator-like 2 n=1 Tax=Amphibalanus amphitrite TaxID=1232801 RepID=UPI001C907866|nr:MOB kinase activator-like 2 [Amphibalanus amphitrite]XP_043220899.1 MOB kinase activator-like 2 [Amphibalanus amphitrite]XP_043220900.1 MOB kinase activator-like 2 [Amphibalanus amphitrite]XP_043220901.1 MOB kinase activator-like 2 [Amphibalanus amphitrite]XP_043220903.1 MOB kinase activator-like 2 [Amphibalanus amphitrite]